MALSVAVIVITSCIAFSEAGQLPSYVTKCKLSSPDIDLCLTINGQKVMDHLSEGVPEFEIVPFVPPELKNIKYGLSNALDFDFSNMKLEIPGITKINYIKLDQKKKKLTYSFTNSGTLTSEYGAKGRLFIIPINVRGGSEIKLINMTYVYKLYYEPEKGVNGKEYWDIVKTRGSYDVGKMEFKFTNLLTEQISKSVSDFVNENWKEIFKEVGDPIMRPMLNGAISDAKKIFELLSVDELFNP